MGKGGAGERKGLVGVGGQVASVCFPLVPRVFWFGFDTPV